jgi:1-acyl-sn-glycerol-3-phosphate acyltransferase
LHLLSVNHYWRIIAAGICYIMFAVGAFLPSIYVFLLALAPLDAAKKQRAARNAIQGLCRFYVNFMQILGLMRYQLSGLPSDPPQGHLVISNHSMLIDALFILAYVPNLCCVVKGALVTNPFTRVPVKLAGYIANNEESFVETAAAKLRLGENVLIFPEGTRNEFDTQLDFKRGAANIAVIADVPILPVIVCCQPRALQKGQHWYNLPDVKSKITVRVKPALAVRDCIDVTQPRTLQYRHLTAWLKAFYLKEIQAIITTSPLTDSSVTIDKHHT